MLSSNIKLTHFHDAYLYVVFPQLFSCLINIQGNICLSKIVYSLPDSNGAAPHQERRGVSLPDLLPVY